MEQRSTIRIIAAFEALKGIVVFAAATGLLAVIHKDLHAFAVRLVEHTHLNPASRYPHIFIEAVGHLQDTRLLLLALGAALYAAVRLFEGYGLYYERAWAEWLAAGSGAIYVPFEVFELLRHPAWYGAALLVINLAVVTIMVGALMQRRRTRAPNAA